MRKHMYPFIITGLLLLPFGMALDVPFDFDTPVIEGANVEMTCAFTREDQNAAEIRLEKQKGSGFLLTGYWGHNYAETETPPLEPKPRDDPDASIRPAMKFEFLAEIDRVRSYKITLLNASKMDEGLYRCAVKRILHGTMLSPEKQLNIVSSFCEIITCANGKCVPSEDSLNASCQCDSTYTGDRCETRVNPCDEMDRCVNGKCEPSDDFVETRCNCSSFYTGDLCDTPTQLNPCYEMDRCVNGKCEPSDDFVETRCDCSSGYTGDLCDTPIQRVSSTSVPEKGTSSPTTWTANVEVTTPDDADKQISSAIIVTHETSLIGMCIVMVYIATIW